MFGVGTGAHSGAAAIEDVTPRTAPRPYHLRPERPWGDQESMREADGSLTRGHHRVSQKRGGVGDAIRTRIAGVLHSRARWRDTKRPAANYGRGVLLVGVAAAAGWVAALITQPGGTPERATTPRQGLTSLPLAAQGPVSAALGSERTGLSCHGPGGRQPGAAPARRLLAPWCHGRLRQGAARHDALRVRVREHP